LNRSTQVPDRAWTLVGVVGLVATAGVVAGLATLLGATRRPAGAKAVAFAAAVCLAGAVAGWLLARWPVSIPARRVAHGLGGAGVRLFTPLLALGWIQAATPELRQAGAGECLLVFYLSLLAVEIFLHIMGERAMRKNSEKNSSN